MCAEPAGLNLNVRAALKGGFLVHKGESGMGVKKLKSASNYKLKLVKTPYMKENMMEANLTQNSENQTTAGKAKTSFITIYLPKKDDTLRKKFWEQTRKGMIPMNGQLLLLLAKDLETLGVLTREESQQIQSFRFGKSSTLKNKGLTSNYSFYIPKELWWLVQSIDRHLNGKIPFRSRSKYIWSLFLKEFLPEYDSKYLRVKEVKAS